MNATRGCLLGMALPFAPHFFAAPDQGERRSPAKPSEDHTPGIRGYTAPPTSSTPRRFCFADLLDAAYVRAQATSAWYTKRRAYSTIPPDVLSGVIRTRRRRHLILPLFRSDFPPMREKKPQLAVSYNSTYS